MSRLNKILFTYVVLVAVFDVAVLLLMNYTYWTYGTVFHWGRKK